MAFDGSMVRAPLWAMLSLAATLIWISVEDVARLSFPIASVVILAGLCAAIAFWHGLPLWLHCAAAVGYAAFFAGLDWFLRKKPDSPALGLGDSLLIGCGAILLGPSEPIQVILLASVSGLLWIGLTKAAGHRPWRAPLPFGLFLSLGIWVTFLEPCLLYTSDAADD